MNPLQILNECKGNPTYYEFYLKDSNCTYPLNNFNSVEDVIRSKSCFLIQSLSEEVFF